MQLRELEIEDQKRKVLAQALPFWYEDKKAEIIEGIKTAREALNLNEMVVGKTQDQVDNGANKIHKKVKGG